MRSKYIQKYIPDHPHASVNGLVYEHILAAEQKIGRPLKSEEVVHHIDGNRSNNSADNLMVFASKNDHTAYHRGNDIYEKDAVWYATRKPMVEKQCKYCGKTFKVARGEDKKIDYCSVECGNKSRRKINVSVSELQKVLFSCNGNFTTASKQLGVSANAIAKKLQQNDLPFHSCDYRRSGIAG